MIDRFGFVGELIAGPCSAETAEQVFDTAGQLSDMGVKCFRASLWKPRTRPGSFEGIGEKGLEWLEEVRRRFGMRVCTEVASAGHVELCLKSGIDMMWIGARTTDNPFLVQEIAEAIGSADVRVLVKNPMIPDVELWAGAVERLRKAGVRDICAVHRGFSTGESGKYRNEPCWGKAVEFRSRFPEIPLYCDPSHISGNVKYVAEICQKALDIGLDGLMVEVHCNPGNALSDVSQQMTPADFASVMSGLRQRSSDADSEEYRRTLASLREQIDELDVRLLEVLAARMSASRAIGHIKKDNNVSILQVPRWDRVLENVCQTAVEKKLDVDFVKRIFNEIHDASVAEQNRIISEL